jgi:hypothetical protein
VAQVAREHATDESGQKVNDIGQQLRQQQPEDPST